MRHRISYGKDAICGENAADFRKGTAILSELAEAIRDAFPVTSLHTLLIPRRHTLTYFDLFEP